MQRDDWILLSLTFLTGLAIGMYIYIAAFKPTYAPENLSDTEAEAGEWSIIGKQRGGDHDARYIHPSFRLLGDGSYVYLPGGMGEGALDPQKGSLSKRQLAAVSFSASELSAYSRPAEAASCVSDHGGYDYEYRITLAGETYVLDTCSTALRDSPKAEELEALWEEFGGTAGESMEYGSFSEWAQDLIRQSIGFDR